jgi:hypothetical protein
MREIIGWEGGDSILAPGGSISNMYALMIARHKLFPQHKKYGMRAIKGQLIMYTSQHVRSSSLFQELVFLDVSKLCVIFLTAPLLHQRGRFCYWAGDGELCPGRL